MTATPADPREPREPREIRIGRYCAAALFLFAGLGKLVGLEAVRETFEHFGYSQDFRLLVGVLETAGAIGLLIGPLVFWAALGLCGIMIGAIWSHFVHDPLYMALPALLVLVLLAAVAWYRMPLRSGRGPVRRVERAAGTR